MTMETTFAPADLEARITDTWTSANAFAAGAGAKEGADSFTIVIPPPNVTGSLHMGHALNNTLQDVLVRRKRMQGFDVLWQPGMDHAGIATQMVVERQLMEQQIHRRDLTREQFLERVWKWKEESGGTIINQLKRLGASCDWSRERFTMDEGLSKAVLKVFVQLHNEGLIYKDKRLVNWDPKLKTAISDLEVLQVETNGNLWHFKYPLADDTSHHITVATTRPETMLGDSGVAVHPDDERYKHLVGKMVRLPLVGRLIPIVADEYADPEAGSGAVKMTPAHDFNDFEVGKRQKLRQINIMTDEAHIMLAENESFLEGLESDSELQELIATLHGLERFKARKEIVARMEAKGLLEKIEAHAHMVPHGDRGGVPIEPYLTDQWYVDAKTLAQPALESVRQERTNFVPKNWEKTYFEWMENIEPWCISRQLWWGHQIPAWYGPDDHIFVAEDEETALHNAIQHYMASEGPWKAWLEDRIDNFHPEELITRDPDVLDTWFSSALWPFSTLGWPDETPELARYYQTDVLVTGFDIIFFWVARMMMMGNKFMDQEPFHTVYIHALVRDEHGAKMSKSKGNVLDPLVLIDEYGADAVRFTLAAMAAQGRDIKLAPARIAGYRNFATKLWNAVRFAQMNGAAARTDFDPSQVNEPVNQWVLTELSRTITQIDEALDGYKFNEAAASAYKFTWNLFCDWYLELLKPTLMGDDGPAKDEARATMAYVIDAILALLHPFMPFITEELWAATAGDVGRENVLALSSWPTLDFESDAAAVDLNWVIELVTQVRSVRAEMNVPQGAKVPAVLVGASDATKTRLAALESTINRIGRFEAITLGDAAPEGTVQLIVGEATLCLNIGSVIDLDAERARLAKEISRLDDEIARINKKLGNEKFTARAPEEVVQGEREKRAGYEAEKDKVKDALERLGQP